MLNLPTTTTELRLVTGAAVTSIVVHASWVDLTQPTTVTPGATDTIVAAAATTTTIVAAPGANTDRNVKFLSVQNTDAVLACRVTIEHFDGVSAIPLFAILLHPGWTIQYNSDGNGFVVYDDEGNIQVSSSLKGIQGIAAGTQTGTTGTIVFSNSNGVTFGMSNSSVVTASYTQSTAPAAISAGTTFASSGTIVFSNSNNVTFGMNAGTVTASASAVSTQGSINLSAGTTSNLGSAFTFANANGISFGLNASTITARGGVGTISVFSQDADFVTNFLAGQALLSFQKLSLAMNLSATALALIANFSGFSNSTEAVTIRHGVYTLSGGTASLASSASRVFSWTTGSQTNLTSVYGGASGTRYRSLGVSYAMTPGDYVFGWWISTANSATVDVFGRAAMNLVGSFDGVETSTFLNGLSASSVAVMPASFAATDTGYVRTGFSALRQPGGIFFGSN